MESQKVVASDADQEDWFGREVSIFGNDILIGAIGDDDDGDDSGAVYSILWDPNVGVIENDSINSFAIYPNPNEGIFTLKTNMINAKMTIYFTEGRVVM